MAVDNFERQAESILDGEGLTAHLHPLMTTTCGSLNQAALALQSLPLLHLAGYRFVRSMDIHLFHAFSLSACVIHYNLLSVTVYSSPRDEILIGHSAIALPALLSEVFSSMCPAHDIPANLLPLPLPLPLRQTLLGKGSFFSTSVETGESSPLSESNNKSGNSKNKSKQN